MPGVGRKPGEWNWRKIAYFGALILLVPFIITNATIFVTFLAVIWIAASRTRRIAAWLAGGTPAR